MNIIMCFPPIPKLLHIDYLIVMDASPSRRHDALNIILYLYTSLLRIGLDRIAYINGSKYTRVRKATTRGLLHFQLMHFIVNATCRTLLVISRVQCEASVTTKQERERAKMRPPESSHHSIIIMKYFIFHIHSYNTK